MNILGVAIEGVYALLLMAVVIAFVFGWKPKLTTLRVLIAGALLISTNLILLYVSQEQDFELYLREAFFLGGPILWLAAYCRNKETKLSKLLILFSMLWMVGFIEYGSVLKNYVTAFCVPVVLIPCFQCWRSPKEEGFIKTSAKNWNVVAGCLCGALTIITLMVSLGWENVMVTRYFKEHQFMLLISAILFFFAKAIPEELIYRGIVQGLIKDKYGITTAVIGAAILYGAAALNDPAVWTFPNWHAAVNALMLGAICGVAYHKTKSLAVSGVLNAAISFLWWALFAHGGY